MANWRPILLLLFNIAGASLNNFLDQLTRPSRNASCTHSPEIEAGSQAFDRRWSGEEPPPASDALWCKAITKGNNLLHAMAYSDSDAGALFSPPQQSAGNSWNIGDLVSWGWQGKRVSNQEWCNWEDGAYWGIAGWLRALRVSEKCKEYGGQWSIHRIAHYNEFLPLQEVAKEKYEGPDGVVRRKTAAEFTIGINAKDGGILALERRGCADRAAQLNPPVPAADFPKLKQSSDIMWAMWSYSEVVPKEFKDNINFFMSLSIEKQETLSIIKRALDSVPVKLSQIGYEFDVDSEAGKAILGSPNAVAFSYFLIQHKAALGGRLISSIRIMEGASKHKAPVAYFEVVRFEDWLKPSLPSQPSGPPIPPRPPPRPRPRPSSVQPRGTQTTDSGDTMTGFQQEKQTTEDRKRSIVRLDML